MRLLHTVRHLRPVQITTRLRWRVVRERPDLRPAPLRRPFDGCWSESTSRAASMTGLHSFRFLNVPREVDTRVVWDDPAWQRLWAYNLHYFDDLVAEAANKRAAWHLALIDDWTTANPPATGIGWDPYPLSCRVVNWIKWSLGGGELPRQATESLAVQLRWLTKHIEYRLLANHVLANAKALVFGGVFFEGREADGWLYTGLAILDKQLPEQILADGGHIERSPMYHSVITYDLLDLIRLAELSGGETESLAGKLPEWRRTASRMLSWLRTMTHPDGQIALLNDAALDVAPSPDVLFNYAASLNIAVPAPAAEGITRLDASGYLRMQRGEAVLICDAAPLGPDYQPGHGHADTLTFEMSLGDRRLIVDTGTSCYSNCAQRLAERGTAAHNTIEVDDEDSSEIWDNFRVARRVQPFVLWADDHGAADPSDGGLDVKAAYNGCRRWSDRGGHDRQWRLNDGVLEIEDTVKHRRFRRAVARFHLHPDTELVEASGETYRAGETSAEVLDRLRPGEVRFRVGGHDVGFASKGTTDTFTAFDYHPRFGVSEPSVCIACELHEHLATFRFDWNARCGS